MDNQNNTRVRMNVSITAKGLVQWDVTAEFPDAERTSLELSDAIDLVRNVIKEKGLKEAGNE